MSGGYDNVSVAGPSSDVKFSSYEYVCTVDPLLKSESLLNVTWFTPHYWCSREMVSQYVTDRMLPGRVPVRALEFPE